MKRKAHFKFTLYIAGDAPNSTQAVANLKSFCELYLKDRHEIEQVCVLREPQRALADSVLLTPMVKRIVPAPARMIVGNLSEQKPLLQLLE
jgi:circadian clock protein KaiB